MLDENLPTFYLRPSSDGVKHNASIVLSHHGSDATAAYSLRHPDPASPDSKNRYAVALYDSYNPEILFGEVLLIPQWTQPTLSQEETRLNGGVPPPPQPMQPTEFTVQLYNPDQQVVVRYKPGSWNSAPHWGFEMPQQSFRQPSTSALDRTQNDPTASETTPKILFKWKKDGKLSKDYVCSLAGKSTNPDGSKRKHREPDITVALFRQLKEITIYESNLSRVDTEDPKGLEVVILLGAVVIKEVFNAQIREVFNIGDAPRRISQEKFSKNSSTSPHVPAVSNAPVEPPLNHRPIDRRQDPHPPSVKSGPAPPGPTQILDPPPPPTDPRSQWEIDVETARLKKQVEQEERERRRAEHAEEKRVKKMVEAEEREALRKKDEIDKETERLKKIFAAEQRKSHTKIRPSLSLRQDHRQQHSAPILHAPFPRPRSVAPSQFLHSQVQPQVHLQTPGDASSGGVFGSSSSNPNGKKLKGKKSFFGMRSFSDESPQQLKKKQSSMW